MRNVKQTHKFQQKYNTVENS